MEYTWCFINHLIDQLFDSHKEYTIATRYLALARGTKKVVTGC